MKASLVVAAARNVMMRVPDGAILHADCGSQNRSKKVLRLLKNNGINGSIGWVWAQTCLLGPFGTRRRWRARGKVIAMVPSRDAVIVRLGLTFDSDQFDGCHFVSDVLTGFPK